MSLYMVTNGPAPTTAASAPLATGTAIKTLVQIKSFNLVRIVEWGISFDGFAAALPVKVELLSTGTVAATVTAHTDATITKLNNSSGAVPSIAGLTLGTTTTGYDASAEGTITATDMYDLQFISPTIQYVKQWPLGREPELNLTDYLRIRVHAGTTVNCYAYIVLEI